MTDIIQTPRKALLHRSRHVPAAPEGCPITAMIARGRKGEARDAQLTVAEQITEGVKRRKPTGIYRRGA